MLKTSAADQYVIVGAHIDSWTTGAVDAGTGYAVLMDLVRTFSQQRRCTGVSGFLFFFCLILDQAHTVENRHARELIRA